MSTKFVMTVNSFQTSRNLSGEIDMSGWMDFLIAITNGETIQGFESMKGTWKDMSQVSFTDSVASYRIKPQQRTGEGKRFAWLNPDTGYFTLGSRNPDGTDSYIRIEMEYTWKELI